MPLRMTVRDVLGDERMWAYGAGERWTPPRPIPPEAAAELPSKVIVPDEGREIEAPRGGPIYRALKRKMRGGPKNYRRADERIREDVCEHLWDEPQVDVRDVSVEVRDGVVTLEGTVPYRHMRYLIEDVAADVSGVHDVENRVRVART